MSNIKKFNEFNSNKKFENLQPVNGISFKEYIKSKGISSGVTMLDVNNCGLTDLIGIDEFVNLTELYCDNNNLTSLPNLDNLTDLIGLDCDNNKLPYDTKDLSVSEIKSLIESETSRN